MYDKRAIGLHTFLLILYIFPLILIIIAQYVWLDVSTFFQLSLVLLFATQTGIVIYVWLSSVLTSTSSLQRVDERGGIGIRKIINRTPTAASTNRTNMLLLSLISIGILIIVVRNLSIFLSSCDDFNSARDIEILNTEKQQQEEVEVEVEVEDSDVLKRDLFSHPPLPPPILNTEYPTEKICKDETSLMIILLVFYLAIAILNLMTIISYVITRESTIKSKTTTTTTNMTSTLILPPVIYNKYDHWLTSAFHFIIVCIVILFQIILVYHVSVFRMGLLLPFGVVTGLLISHLCHFQYISYHPTPISYRILIIVFSLWSLANALTFLIKNGSLLLQECPTIVIPPPHTFPPPTIPPPTTTPHHHHHHPDIDDPGDLILAEKNKMFFTHKDFNIYMVMNICQNEKALSIFFIIFLVYLMILQLATFCIYIWAIDSRYYSSSSSSFDNTKKTQFEQEKNK